MLPEERLKEISNKIHQNLTKNDIDRIYDEIKRLYSIYSNSLSSLCVTKVQSTSSLSTIWDIMIKSIGKEDMVDLIKIAMNDRPLDLVKSSTTYKTILVLCIFAIMLKDTTMLTLVLHVYSFIRFYSSFVARLKICDADTLRLALDRLTLKSIIKQKNGNYTEVCIRIMKHFYDNYVKQSFEVHNYNVREVILKLVIVLDYSRTRIKEVQNVLIRTYYDIYNNKEKYSNQTSQLQQQIQLDKHITHIYAKFLQICRSETEHTIYSKNLIPADVAKCICSNYLHNDDYSFELVRSVISVISRNIDVDPCHQDFSYKVRKLFTKKSLQPFFKKIDDKNFEILQKCNLNVTKWFSSMRRHVIYKINTRSYTLFLIYMAIVRTLCSK